MKEKLYAIPVNDAFNSDCECPICSMYDSLEKDAVDYTMGPSYMEDDIRMRTDDMGFCNKHIKMVFDKENRLGMGLVINTHMNKINRDIKALIDGGATKSVKKNSLFSKKPASDNEIVDYINSLEDKCFVCDKIDNVFARYIATIFHLYKTDKDFLQRYKQCKGFRVGHYKILLVNAPQHLAGDTLQEFLDTTNQLYIKNMQRVNEDVDWFVAKFDYRHDKDPWKNAKDSLPRSMIKLNQSK